MLPQSEIIETLKALKLPTDENEKKMVYELNLKRKSNDLDSSYDRSLALIDIPNFTEKFKELTISLISSEENKLRLTDKPIVPKIELVNYLIDTNVITQKNGEIFFDEEKYKELENSLDIEAGKIKIGTKPQDKTFLPSVNHMKIFIYFNEFDKYLSNYKDVSDNKTIVIDNGEVKLDLNGYNYFKTRAIHLTPTHLTLLIQFLAMDMFEVKDNRGKLVTDLKNKRKLENLEIVINENRREEIINAFKTPKNRYEKREIETIETLDSDWRKWSIVMKRGIVSKGFQFLPFSPIDKSFNANAIITSANDIAKELNISAEYLLDSPEFIYILQKFGKGDAIKATTKSQSGLSFIDYFNETNLLVPKHSAQKKLRSSKSYETIFVELFKKYKDGISEEELKDYIKSAVKMSDKMLEIVANSKGDKLKVLKLFSNIKETTVTKLTNLVDNGELSEQKFQSIIDALLDLKTGFDNINSYIEHYLDVLNKEEIKEFIKLKESSQEYSEIPYKSGSIGNYRWEFIYPDDFRYYLLGEYTNCCMTIDNKSTGWSCVMYGVYNPKKVGAILIYKDDKPIAQAWTWFDNSKRRQLTLDNVEILNKELDLNNSISSIFDKNSSPTIGVELCIIDAIRQYMDTGRYDIVTIGAGMQDLSSAVLKARSISISPKKAELYFPTNIYSDAKETQYIFAMNNKSDIINYYFKKNILDINENLEYKNTKELLNFFTERLKKSIDGFQKYEGKDIKQEEKFREDISNLVDTIEDISKSLERIYKTHITALKEYVNKNPKLNIKFNEFLKKYNDTIVQQTVSREKKTKIYDLPKKKVVTIDS